MHSNVGPTYGVTTQQMEDELTLRQHIEYTNSLAALCLI
jgi:hypothetical protein